MVIKHIGYDYTINNTALVGSNFYFGILNVNLLLTMSKSYAQVNCIGIGIGIGLLKIHIAASKAELHEITV